MVTLIYYYKNQFSKVCGDYFCYNGNNNNPKKQILWNNVWSVVSRKSIKREDPLPLFPQPT